MDKGGIVERGTHNELLQQGGVYEQMWSLQKRVEQDTPVF
jgi:ABC-type transport system involved in Fe-S cluster assembly fused permease/ATPase subunit